MDLLNKKCVPCESGVPPLEGELLKKYLTELGEEWEFVDGKSIARNFKFKDFKEAMVFVDKVADLAESEGHHPDFDIRYNKVRLELSTHSIGGLSENDFILASKIGQL